MQSNSSHFWHETMAVLLVHKQCYKTDKLHTRMTHLVATNKMHDIENCDFQYQNFDN